MSTPQSTPLPQVSQAAALSRPGPRVEAFGLSDAGVQRRSNEDSFAVVPELGLFMVADGVGGAAAGEVASRMAIDVVVDTFRDPDVARPRGGTGRPLSAALARLKTSIEHANACVHGASVAKASLTGMGTTIAALLVHDEAAVLAHVGDSRIYALRGRRFEQLTTDHSVTNVLVAAGLMTPAQALASDVRHVISRAIGAEPEVEVEARAVAIHPGDTFLLATDGLHGVVDDETIAAILLRERDLAAAASRLIARANALGGPDNITVVLVRV